MADLHAFLANFVGAGHELTTYGNRTVRDTLRFSCGGYHFKLVQSDEVIGSSPSEFNGRFIRSSRLEVQNVDAKHVEKALRVVERICWLLSFAALSNVTWYAYEYPAGSGGQNTRSVVAESLFFRPVIDIREGVETSEFIERCYPQYARLERKRKLNIVTAYMVQAERVGQPVEVRLLLAFVALESLKDTYARSTGIPYIKGFFRKRPKPRRVRDTYSFEELLQQMFQAVGMRRGLKRVIALRNEIIHSGVTRKSFDWQWNKYENLQYLIREYVLRALNHEGSYFTGRERGHEQRRL